MDDKANTYKNDIHRKLTSTLGYWKERRREFHFEKEGSESSSKRGIKLVCIESSD